MAESSAPFHGTPDPLFADAAEHAEQAVYNLRHAFLAADAHDAKGLVYFWRLALADVRAGTEIRVTTERPTMSLILTEMDAGSWVIFELPGFTTAASGTEQSSLAALRTATDTSYFKDRDTLWVKVVSNGNGARGPIGGGPGGGTSLQVSR